jgi:hypothetical protein
MTRDGFSLTDRIRNRHEEDVPLKVSYGSFVRFDYWVDEQLTKLVRRWAHRAAPNAQRGRLGRERETPLLH